MSKVDNSKDQLKFKLHYNSKTFIKKESPDLSKIVRGTGSINEFYDVLLISKENKLKAHRVILAEHSDYFKNRLKNDVLVPEKTKKSSGICILDMSNLNWNCVRSIVEYMYTGNITVTSDNVYALVETSDHLLMPEVRLHCLEFLEASLQSSNCIKVLKFARISNNADLAVKAQTYLFVNFHTVYVTEDFKALDSHQLAQLLRYMRDRSAKICESLIFLGIVEWVNEDSRRKCNFPELFGFVQLHRLKLSCLVSVISNEELVTSSLDCMQHLMKAIQSHCDGTNMKREAAGAEYALLANGLNSQREKFANFFHKPVAQRYVICSKWLSNWVKYVTNDGYQWDSKMRLPDRPGPIDNSLLFTSESCRMLKRHLTPVTDYKFVPERSWKLLSRCYGVVKGQQPISEKGPCLAGDIFDCDLTDNSHFDPISLTLRSNSEPAKYVRTFSKWDRLNVVEKEMRKLFGISETTTIVLGNHYFKKLDTAKLIFGQEIKNTIWLWKPLPELDWTENPFTFSFEKSPRNPFFKVPVPGEKKSEQKTKSGDEETPRPKPRTSNFSTGSRPLRSKVCFEETKDNNPEEKSEQKTKNGDEETPRPKPRTSNFSTGSRPLRSKVCFEETKDNNPEEKIWLRKPLPELDWTDIPFTFSFGKSPRNPFFKVPVPGEKKSEQKTENGDEETPRPKPRTSNFSTGSRPLRSKLCFEKTKDNNPEEKAPDPKDRSILVCDLTNNLHLDPISLTLKEHFSKEKYVRTFSKWDRLNVVEKEIRKLFEIPKSTPIVLQNHLLKRLDTDKPIAEQEITNKVWFRFELQPAPVHELPILSKDYYNHRETKLKENGDKKTPSFQLSCPTSVSRPAYKGGKKKKESGKDSPSRPSV